jgi:hypothetical protein
VTEIDLSVDGEPVDLIDTIRMHQREPHPGGHRYRLTLRGRALTVFDRFGIESSGTERRPDGDAVFFAIESIAARLPGEGQIPARFILNTVDQVVRDGGEASVSGVCSVPVF